MNLGIPAGWAGRQGWPAGRCQRIKFVIGVAKIEVWEQNLRKNNPEPTAELISTEIFLISQPGKTNKNIIFLVLNLIYLAADQTSELYADEDRDIEEELKLFVQGKKFVLSFIRSIAEKSGCRWFWYE